MIAETILLEQRPHLNSQSTVSEFVHNTFLRCLKLYISLGGMPEAVSCYLEHQSLVEVRKVHEELISSFLQDILKYERKIDIDALRDIMEIVPGKVGKPIKFSQLHNDLSHYKIKQLLSVLEKCLIVHRVRSTSAHGLPLGAQVNSKVFKLIFLDIGLIQFISGIASNEIFAAKNLLNTYKGALCELFVGQELLAGEVTENGKLYYWSRAVKNSSSEVDYVIVKDGRIIPVEVKNGLSGKLKSLHIFLKEHENIEIGYVFNSGNIGTVENIKFFPLYTRIS